MTILDGTIQLKPRLLAFCISLFWPLWCNGQQALPQQVDIERQRVPVAPPSTGLGFDLKFQSTDKSGVSKSVDELLFQVANIEVLGSTVYEQQQLDRIFSDLLNTPITLAQVRTAAEQLETQYRDEGFFLTRVFIPPQSIGAGVLRVQVVEGFIGEVKSEGLTDNLDPQIQARFAEVLAEKPIRLRTLESALLRLNDLPGLTAQGVLKAGREFGSSTLTLNVSQNPTAQSFSVSNNASTLVGPWGSNYSILAAQPLGGITQPHTLSVGVSGSGGHLKEVRSINAVLSTPLGLSNWIGSLGALYAQARPGGAVSALDLLSQSSSVSLRTRYSVVRTRQNSIYLDLGLALNRTESTLVSQVLSADQTTVGEMGLSWVRSGSSSGTLLASVNLIQALSVFGAMDAQAPRPSITGFEPRFQKMTSSVLWSLPLADGYSVQTNLSGQYTKDKLLSGEQVAYGATAFGRAFEPSTLVGDRGYGASVELRKDLGIDTTWVKTLQLYGFVDGAKTQSLPTGGFLGLEASLSSAGVGTRAALEDGWFVDLFFARAQSERGLQVLADGSRAVIAISRRF